MPYSATTLAQAQIDLAARLYDPGQKFWTSGELTRYITEALRTWNALTSYWRQEMVWTLDQGNWWYEIPDLPGSQREFTITDLELIELIELHLLEPLTSDYPLTWTGTRQFSLQDILGAIQRKRDEVLSASGCTVVRTVVPVSPGRTFLNDKTLDIRRIVWFPQGFVMTWDSSSPLTWEDATFTWDTTPPDLSYSPGILKPSDDWALQAFNRRWTGESERPPRSYRQSAQPPLSFDVDAVPPVPGAYDILTTEAGGALTTVSASLLRVPDDWAWVIKWGALGDLLGRESNAKDSLRAQYCMARYAQGLALMALAPAALSARMNNLPLPLDAVQNGDDFNRSWQWQAQGSPKRAYLAGLNLIAFGPAPDSSGYSATLSVVRNAPVPSDPGDFLQVGRDDYDAILSYAQHLGSFKMGGAEFASTFPLLDTFIKQAALYNSKLKTLGNFQLPMFRQSQLEEERLPRFAESGVLE